MIVMSSCLEFYVDQFCFKSHMSLAILQPIYADRFLSRFGS